MSQFLYMWLFSWINNTIAFFHKSNESTNFAKETFLRYINSKISSYSFKGFQLLAPAIVFSLETIDRKCAAASRHTRNHPYISSLLFHLKETLSLFVCNKVVSNYMVQTLSNFLYQSIFSSKHIRSTIKINISQLNGRYLVQISSF
jgi:hypothetical protein